MSLLCAKLLRFRASHRRIVIMRVPHFRTQADPRAINTVPAQDDLRRLMDVKLIWRKGRNTMIRCDGGPRRRSTMTRMDAKQNIGSDPPPSRTSRLFRSRRCSQRLRVAFARFPRVREGAVVQRLVQCGFPLKSYAKQVRGRAAPTRCLACLDRPPPTSPSPCSAR